MDRRKRRNQYAALRGDALKAPLESLASGIIFWTGRQKALAPLRDLLLGWFSAIGPHPDKRFLIRSTGQHPLLERFLIELQKIDQILIEPDRDVVVILNLAHIPQANLVDKPTQVGNVTEQSFGTEGVGLYKRALLTRRNAGKEIMSRQSAYELGNGSLIALATIVGKRVAVKFTKDSKSGSVLSSIRLFPPTLFARAFAQVFG